MHNMHLEVKKFGIWYLYTNIPNAYFNTNYFFAVHFLYFSPYHHKVVKYIIDKYSGLVIFNHFITKSDVKTWLSSLSFRVITLGFFLKSTFSISILEICGLWLRLDVMVGLKLSNQNCYLNTVCDPIWGLLKVTFPLCILKAQMAKKNL